MIGTVVAGLAGLAGVILGGWLSMRGQDRMAQREHERQWRDVRLRFYYDFLAAHRKYVAFVQEPTARISAKPHPRSPGHLMPLFDEAGRPYKETLEAGFTAMRLVALSPETVGTAVRMVADARQLAAMRATCSATELPSDVFRSLWEEEQRFLNAIRGELGLQPMERDPNATR
ncbi:hypothetical protein ABZX93_26450 [Streptomyces sp. NPDC006632]|uniref:hypothetical protein n=1 Tax=Streptomyces sp. NPDC006632 TaxID=3157182 RepID=UPI0033ADE246